MTDSDETTSRVGLVDPEGTRPGGQRGTDASVKSAARNGAWGVVGAAAGAGLGLLLTLVVAKTSGAAGAGAFFSATALATIVIALCALGADTGVLWALPRDVALSGGAKVVALVRGAVTPVLAMSAVAAVTFWLLAPWIAQRLGGPDLHHTTSLIRMLCLAILVGPTVQVLVQVTRALGNLVPFVFVQQVGVPSLRVVGVLAVGLLSGATLSHLGLAWGIPLVPAAVYLLLVCRVRVRRLERRRGIGHERRQPADRKEFWRFALVRGLGTACQLSLVWLDVVLVAVLTGAREAGIYAVASRFATSGQLALQAMRLAIAPQMSAAFARKDHESVRQLYSMSATWAMLFSWPIFVTLIVFAPWLLGLFGRDFLDGTLPLAIVCAAMMFNVAMGNVGTLLLMSGNSVWSTATTAIALFADVGMILLLVPHLGATGAAIAWLVSIVAQNSIGLWVIHYRLHLPLRRKGTVVHAVVCLAVPLATALLAHLVLGATTAAVAAHLVALLPALAVYCWLRRHFLRLELLPMAGRVSRLLRTR